MAMHTISAEQLLKAYNGKYKYVVKDKDDSVVLMQGGGKVAVNKQMECWQTDLVSSDVECLGQISITEFQGKDWRTCIYEKEPSEEEWVGKSCWFSDDKESIEKGNNQTLGVLEKIITVEGVKMYWVVDGSNPYYYCRPVRPDEIKFVEN